MNRFAPSGSSGNKTGTTRVLAPAHFRKGRFKLIFVGVLKKIWVIRGSGCALGRMECGKARRAEFRSLAFASFSVMPSSTPNNKKPALHA
jgi:hypothetical protein